MSDPEPSHEFELLESARNGCLLRCKKCKVVIVAITVSDGCWPIETKLVEQRIVNE